MRRAFHSQYFYFVEKMVISSFKKKRRRRGESLVLSGRSCSTQSRCVQHLLQIVLWFTGNHERPRLQGRIATIRTTTSILFWFHFFGLSINKSNKTPGQLFVNESPATTRYQVLIMDNYHRSCFDWNKKHREKFYSTFLLLFTWFCQNVIKSEIILL